MSVAPASVAEIVQVGGAHVGRLLEHVEASLVRIARDGAPVLSAHASETISAGGKRLRPLLVLLAAGEPPADERGLVRAAVAVELIHSATLVHDDVLDMAALRRGRPTVYATGGREAATATGDLLFSRAFAELVANRSADQVRVLSAASQALALGELLQREDAWNAGISLDRYLLRCELKTARLFEAACRLGVLEAGGDPEPLARFGRRIGIAFQLLDDVLDVAGPAERTGKHRGTDLIDGTMTLPLILARASDPDLAALDPRSVTTPGEAERVCDRIAATGALDAARARALEMVREASAELPAGLPPGQHRALDLVAEGVVARYS